MSNKKRIVAAVLALFLGGIGAHKFYLGKNAQGFVYLIFVWTFAPAIIAFFEGIGYLLSTDEAFEEKYGVTLSQKIQNLQSISSTQQVIHIPEPITPLHSNQVTTEYSFCVFCGARIEPDCAYCPSCGALQDEGQTPSSQNANQPVTNLKSKKEQLIELKSLFDSGSITEEDFTQKKLDILNS